MSDAHRWTFFRAGGFDQVKLASGADLANLGALDQKLWVALACPTNGLEIDARTLALIDTDKDGRVRAPELIAAATFACDNLKNPDDLFKGEAGAAARRDQRRAPRGEDAAGVGPAHPGRHRQDRTSPSISLEDVGDPARIFADTVFNGDGVITETAAEDDATRALIREIGDTHRHGARSLRQAGHRRHDHRRLLRRGARLQRLVRPGRREPGQRLSPRPRTNGRRRRGRRRHQAQGRRLLRALPAGGVRPARAAGAEPQRRRSTSRSPPQT